MELLKPSHFFSLASFQHRELFDENKPVWDALKRLKDYLEKCQLGSISADIPSGAYLIDPELISIGEGTVIEPGAYIKGPCVIGKNCTVRHGAYLRGNILTGDHCVLGHDSEFKNAILLNHANAAHFAYVGDTILGNHVNLGAGTVCANLKLNRGEISVSIDSERIKTGLRKFGAIMGDEVQTGCNSVTNPGTLLGKGASCYPCSNFGGYVPAGMMVKMDASVMFVEKQRRD